MGHGHIGKIREHITREFERIRKPAKEQLICSAERSPEEITDVEYSKPYTRTDASKFQQRSEHLLHQAAIGISGAVIRRRLVHRAWVMRGSDGWVLDIANLPSLEDALAEAVASVNPNPKPPKRESILLRKVF